MRHIKTSHFRLINLAVAVLLITSLLSDELGFLPEYGGYIVGGSLVIAVLVFLFVKPADDLGPIKVPHLSPLWIRIVSGSLLLISMLCLANFYLFNPGYFQPYKKQVMVAAFAVMGIFVILYAPAFAHEASNDSGSDSRDA